MPGLLAKRGTLTNETNFTIILLESWKPSPAHVVLSSVTEDNPLFIPLFV